MEVKETVEEKQYLYLPGTVDKHSKFLLQELSRRVTLAQWQCSNLPCQDRVLLVHMILQRPVPMALKKHKINALTFRYVVWTWEIRNNYLVEVFLAFFLKIIYMCRLKSLTFVSITNSGINCVKLYTNLNCQCRNFFFKVKYNPINFSKY